MIGVATDVTERRKLEKELEHRAFHDPLTDLPNRALFMDRLSHALERTDRRRVPVAMLFMDLDGFKAVNDHFGHDEGDRVLIEIARRLRGCLRPEDTVSRFGGDEFAVLLEETYYQESGDVAERILQKLRVPFFLGDGSEVSFTISIGVAHSTSSRQTPAELFRVADGAMYQAKAGGRDTLRHG